VSPGLFTLVFFEEPSGRRPVEDWMESELSDLELAALIAGFEHVLSYHGIGVCQSEWGKQLGEGLFEFRIRHTATEIRRMFGGQVLEEHTSSGKVLLRVFCYAYGAKIVLLLNGYNKEADPSVKRQRREIALARRRLTEFQERQARERKAKRRGGGGRQ
jgi:hypothetical protein